MPATGKLPNSWCWLKNRSDDGRALLAEQARFRVPIGQYFIENGILQPGRVDELLRELDIHNSQYPLT